MRTAATNSELGMLRTRSISRVRYTSALTVRRSNQGIIRVFVPIVITATANRCSDPTAIPSSTAESVSSSDCRIKSCRDASTCRVATTPSAVSRNSAPVNASSADRMEKDGLSIVFSLSDFGEPGDHGDDRGHESGAEKFRDAEQPQLGERGFDVDQHQDETEDLQEHERDCKQHLGQSRALRQ